MQKILNTSNYNYNKGFSKKITATVLYTTHTSKLNERERECVATSECEDIYEKTRACAFKVKTSLTKAYYCYVENVDNGKRNLNKTALLHCENVKTYPQKFCI